MRRLITTLIVGAMMFTFAASAQAAPGSLVLNVPDWNQPSVLAYPGDGLPAGGYPLWCSPTAGGNLMGYWEDVMGCTGLTDRKAFNATTGYPGTPGTWQQGLYHDGIIEMGWFMDTGNWQSTVPPVFPAGAGMTGLNMILPGLLGYAAGSWTDDSFGPGPGTGIVKVSCPANGFTDPLGTPALQMWTNYCGELDAARPVEVTFDKWVDTTQRGADVTIDGFELYPAETYPWDLSTDPHSVVGVGYIDPTPLTMIGDEWFVCQDGWGSTGQYVAVPFDSKWQQNDYVTSVIPEPGTLALLAMAGLGLLLFAWRRRK